MVSYPPVLYGTPPRVIHQFWAYISTDIDTDLAVEKDIHIDIEIDIDKIQT